jgi:hypothetical protein
MSNVHELSSQRLLTGLLVFVSLLQTTINLRFEDITMNILGLENAFISLSRLTISLDF